MDLNIEGVLAPEFSPEAYLQLDADLTKNPWWTLSAGAEGDAKVKVTILERDLKDFDEPDVFAFSKIIAQAGGGYSPSNAAPILSNISPSTALAGAAGLTLTLTGSNFAPGATAYFSGTPLATTFVNPQQLTASLTAGSLSVAGTFAVAVTNPAPPGASSLFLSFAVQSVTVPNPQPSISILSPNSAVSGTSSLTVTISGGGFLNSSTVTFNGIIHPATFVSSGQLTITLNSSDLSTPGSYPVVVTNPTPGGGSSQPSTFTVQAAPVTPTLQSLTLNVTAVAGGSPVTGVVTLSGPALTGGAQVSLSSNDSSVQVPTTVTVAGGQSSATFPITTSPVTSVQTVTIRASLGSSIQTATLTVSPVVTSQNIFLGNTLDFQGTALLDGATIHYGGEVVFNGLFTYASFGNLTDSTSTVTIGVNFTNQGASISGNTATFPSVNSSMSGYGNVNNGNPFVAQITVGTLSVTVASTDLGSLVTGTLQFTVAGTVHQTTFTGTISSCSGCIVPPGTPSLQGLALSSAAVDGGFFVSGTVSLNAAAPPGDTTVYLLSNNPALPVDPTVTVPGGQSSVGFTVLTTTVTSAQTVTLSAGLGSVLKNATLTVSPTTLINPWTQPMRIVGTVTIDNVSQPFQCTVASYSYAIFQTPVQFNTPFTIALAVGFNQAQFAGQSLTFAGVDSTSIFANLTTDPTGAGIQTITAGTLTLTATSSSVGTPVTGMLSFTAGGVTRQIPISGTVGAGQ